MPTKLVVQTALVLLIVLCIGIADADVPRKIHYQALLQSPSGQLIGGHVDFAIRIFDAQVGGQVLWEEEPMLEITAGRLDLTLPVLDGEGFHPAYFDEMLAADELWLEITARPKDLGETFTFPRQQILTSGYALRTATIDGAQGGTIQGSLNVLGDLTLPDGIELIASGGNLIIQSPTSSITMAPDGTLTIESSSIVISSTGDLDLIGDTVRIEGNNIDVKASAQCTVEGSAGLDLRSSAILTALGSLIKLN